MKGEPPGPKGGNHKKTLSQRNHSKKAERADKGPVSPAQAGRRKSPSSAHQIKQRPKGN